MGRSVALCVLRCAPPRNDEVNIVRDVLPGLDGVCWLVGWSLRLCSVGSSRIACDVELLWLMSECAASTACFSTQHCRTQDCRTTLDVADGAVRAAAACLLSMKMTTAMRCDGCAIEV